MTSSAGSGFPGRLFRAEVERKSALSAPFPNPTQAQVPQAQATMSQVDDYDESNYSQTAQESGAWSPTEAVPNQGLQEGGDDGMGSPVRQQSRGKDKSKSKPKAAPKEKKEKKERKSRAKGPAAKKPMEVAKENMLKKRKAAAEELAAAAEVDAAAPKATKRARTMQTKAAAMAETSSASGTPLMNKIESLLKHVDEQDACVAALVDDEDVNQFLSRTYSDVLGVFSARMSGAPLTPLTEEVDSDFEVVDIPDTPPFTRARTVPASRRPSLAPSASPPRAEGDHFGKLWGPWALEARDRAGQQGTERRASLVEAERKLMQYYAVPFEVWAAVPEGTHTKYTTLKRYGAKPEDEDFADRRVVHAVVQGAIAGGKPGRMCMGWKSDKAPWPRGDHDSFNWYLQRGALPQGWKAPGSR